MKPRAYPPGIRCTATSWQVYVRRDGVLKTKRFPLTTGMDRLKRERDKLIGRLVEPRDLEVATHGRAFSADADEYLQLVRAMPSYSDRAFHIEQWKLAFGDRPRSTITARQIAAVLEGWRVDGRADGEGLSPGSLNRRRTALMHLYTRLDGKAVPNPVKDVPRYSEHASDQVRAVSLLTLAQVIRHTRPTSQNRARLRVLMWTGWPHKLLKGVQPGDVDWTRGRVRLGRRGKGAGMAAAWVPVVPQALRALRRYAALNCYGDFSHSSLWKALVRAVDVENARRAALGEPTLAHLRPYDLRHSFATWAAGIVKDDRALRELLRTNSIKRYTEGATADRLEAAVGALAGTRRERPVAFRSGNSGNFGGPFRPPHTPSRPIRVPSDVAAKRQKR